MKFKLIYISSMFITGIMGWTFAQSGDMLTGGNLTGDVLTGDILTGNFLPINQDNMQNDKEEGHSLFPEIIEEAIELEEKPEQLPSFELDHEIVPLVLEQIEIEEIELCRDGEEVQEEGTKCDDKNSYSEDDTIQEDGCTCKGKIPPIEIIESDSRILYSEDGLPILSTVESYDVTGGGAPRCSMIARLNLKKFYPNRPLTSDIQGPNSIVLGDAVTLILQGKNNGVLSEILARDMQSILEKSNDFAHDLFIHSPKGYSVDTPKYFLQGHRAVVFKASDKQWYIIDPLRGSATTQPQVLREYLYHYTNKDGVYYMYTSTISQDIESNTASEISGICNISLSNPDGGSLLFQENTEGQFCFDIQFLCKEN